MSRMAAYAKRARGRGMDDGSSELLDGMARRLVPNVTGCRAAKEALLLMLAGGGDMPSHRQDLNVLLAGGPAEVRGALCAAAAEIVPLGLHVPSTGAIYADGVMHLDGFNGMSADDRSAVYDLLADRCATVRALGMSYGAEASGPLLATVGGRRGGWDGALTLTENTGLPARLLLRFDVVCVVDGRVERGVRTGGLLWDTQAAHIRAARRIIPEMSDGAKKLAREHYAEVRWSADVQVKPRYLEAVALLAGAHAKLHLSSDVHEGSVRCAIRMAEAMAPVRTRDRPPRVVLGTGGM